jgi:hypothetical protein
LSIFRCVAMAQSLTKTSISVSSAYSVKVEPSQISCDGQLKYHAKKPTF